MGTSAEAYVPAVVQVMPVRVALATVMAKADWCKTTSVDPWLTLAAITCVPLLDKAMTGAMMVCVPPIVVGPPDLVPELKVKSPVASALTLMVLLTVAPAAISAVI